MFTGMALRMVVELGLHREKDCLAVNEPRADIKSERNDAKTSSDVVSLEQYEQSS